MGNAAIWWEPRGSQVVRKIDLGAPLSELRVSQDRIEDVTETQGGVQSTTRIRSRERIRITSTPWLSYGLWDEVSAMVRRLQQGGRISLAEDDATAWAAFALDWTDPDQIIMQAGPWAAYGGAVATGQRFRVLGPSPRMLWEGGRINGGALNFNSTAFRAGGVIVPQQSRANDWGQEGWILVRQLGFWPVLRFPSDMRQQSGILHEHRRSFSLELTLEMDMAGIGVLAQTPTQLLNGVTDAGNPTLTELIRAGGAA